MSCTTAFYWICCNIRQEDEELDLPPPKGRSHGPSRCSTKALGDLSHHHAANGAASQRAAVAQQPSHRGAASIPLGQAHASPGGVWELDDDQEDLRSTVVVGVSLPTGKAAAPPPTQAMSLEQEWADAGDESFKHGADWQDRRAAENPMSWPALSANLQDQQRQQQQQQQQQQQPGVGANDPAAEAAAAAAAAAAEQPESQQDSGDLLSVLRARHLAPPSAYSTGAASNEADPDAAEVAPTTVLPPPAAAASKHDAGAPTAAAAAAAPPRPPLRAVFLFGSQTGMSQEIARTLHAEAVGQRGIAGDVMSLNQLGFDSLTPDKTPIVVIITSSTGNGDPPDNAAKFYRKLMTHQPCPSSHLAGVKFAVLGLGDSSYKKFMNVPRSIRGRLAEMGAEEFYEGVEADDAYGQQEKTTEAWCSNIWGPLQTALAAISTTTAPAGPSHPHHPHGGPIAALLHDAGPSAESSAADLAELVHEPSRFGDVGAGGGPGLPRVQLEMSPGGAEGGVGSRPISGQQQEGPPEGEERREGAEELGLEVQEEGASVQAEGVEGGEDEGEPMLGTSEQSQEGPRPGSREDGKKGDADRVEGDAAQQPGSALRPASGEATPVQQQQQQESQQQQQQQQQQESQESRPGSSGQQKPASRLSSRLTKSSKSRAMSRQQGPEEGQEGEGEAPQGLVDGVAPEGVDLRGAPQFVAPRFDVTFGVSPEVAQHVKAKELSRPSLEQRGYRDASGTYGADAPFWSKVAGARLLTSPSSDRVVIHCELDITGSGITYSAGDAVAIQPQNDPALVDALLCRLGADGDDVFEVKPASGGPKSATGLLPHIEWPCTLRHALTHGVEIAGVPKKGLLRVLAEFSADETEKRTLMFLCAKAGKDDYNKDMVAGQPTLVDLLDRFKSCTPPLPALLDALPPLAPRMYSVAATQPATGASRLQFAFSLVTLTNPSGAPRYGVTTGWLYRLLYPWIPPRGDDITGGRLGGGHSRAGSGTSGDAWVPLYLRRSEMFRPPTDLSIPMIMIGPGTGVAPFRAFLQERGAEAAAAGGAVAGEAWLYFGCRKRDEDYLYGQEFEDFERTGVLTRLRVAFSREDGLEAGWKKTYVQHLIRQDGKELAELIVRHGAHVYVCGHGGAMAREVQAALVAVLQAFVGLSEGEAGEELKAMAEKGAYVRELYSGQ